MVEEVKIKTMFDEESGMASVTLMLRGEGKAEIFFQGEDRSVVLSQSGVREDFYVLSARAWNGMDAPKLYFFTIEDEKGKGEYAFGFRNIGLDPQRGFFLSSKPYPLNGENTIITRKEEDLVSSDRSGIVAAYMVDKDEIEKGIDASILNHPSLSFLSYEVREESTEEEMRKVNSVLYSLDATRPTMGIFRREMRKGEERIFDVSLVSPLSSLKGRITAYFDKKGFSL